MDSLPCVVRMKNNNSLNVISYLVSAALELIQGRSLGATENAESIFVACSLAAACLDCMAAQ